MNKFLIAVSALVLAGLSFGVGVFWAKYTLLEGGAVVVREAMILSSEGEPGTLPKGSILYPYRHSGEISTFVLFVNTKALQNLAPVEFEHQLTVAPVEAYLP